MSYPSQNPNFDSAILQNRLLVGTETASTDVMVTVVNSVDTSSSPAAIDVTATNVGSGRAVGLSVDGVNTYVYTTQDRAEDDYNEIISFIVDNSTSNSYSNFASRILALHNGSDNLTNTDVAGGLSGGYSQIYSNSSSAVTVSKLTGRAFTLGTQNSGILTDGIGLSVEYKADGGNVTNAVAMDLLNDATGSASVLNHFFVRTESSSPWVDSDTLRIELDGATRYIPTYDQPIASGAYSQTFTDGDLTAGVLSINHALNQDILFYVVLDNNGKVIQPDDVDYTDADNVDIDLSSYGTITGTWSVLLSIGNPSTGANVSILDDTEIEIFSAQDLLDASSGTGTITVDGASLLLTFRNSDTITSPVRIVAQNGADITIKGSSTGTWAWSNVGTMITATDSSVRIRGMNLAGVANLSSPFSANLVDFNSSSNTAYTFNITRCNLLYWVGGTHDTGILLLRSVGFIDWFGALELTNTGIVEITGITMGKINVPALGQNCIEITSSDPESFIRVVNAGGRIDAGDYFFRIDPLFSGKILYNGIVTTGDLFNESGTDGTFTAIADATLTAQAIAEVIDSPTSPGTARFRWPNTGNEVFVYQQVTISGYTTNTDYNVSDVIISAAGDDGSNYYMEIDGVDYGSDEATGTFDSDSITLLTPDTLSDGDTVYIDGEYSIEIDGGTYVYNAVAATSFQINATYPGATTYNGTWCSRGLDERNPRVLVATSPGNRESAYRAFVHVEDNEQTTTSVDGVYGDVDVSGTSAAITVYATNGVGGTTVTSAGHGLGELQNVTITGSGDDTYNGAWTIFNVLTDTFDIGVAFSTNPTTKGSWDTAPIVGDSMERFKLTDPDTMEVTYIGREDRSFTARTTIGAIKTGSSQDYQFAMAFNGSVPDGASYSPRTISTAISSIGLSQDVELSYGDTIKLQQAGKGTSNILTITNLRQEVS